MKFIIDKNTNDRFNRELISQIAPVLDLLGSDGREVAEAILCTEVTEITHLKHLSLTIAGDDLILWVDDEVLLEHLSLVGKFARFVAPIALSFKLFMHDFNTEVAKLANKFFEEK